MTAIAEPHAEHERAATRHFFARLWTQEAALVFMGACVGLVYFNHFTDYLSPDSWLTLVGGREVAVHGLPRHNEITLLGGGRTSVDQQWLGQLAFYGLHRISGEVLAVFLHVMLLVSALILAFVVLRRRGVPPSRIAPFAVPLLVLSPAFFLRAETFAHLFFVALLALLASESRKRSWRVVLSIPILVLWANVHGSVLVGAAMIALLGLSELLPLVRGRSATDAPLVRALLLTLLPWLGIFASPYGFDLLSYYRSTIGNPYFPELISEWAAPTFLSGPTLFLLAFVAIALISRHPREITAFEGGALCLTLIGALLANRSAIWFAYAALLILPGLLARAWPAHDRPAHLRRTERMLALAAVVALVTVASSALLRSEDVWARSWPRAATEKLAEIAQRDPEARLLAPKDGSWLLFAVPELRGRTAFDGRWENLSGKEIVSLVAFTSKAGDEWEAASAGYRLVAVDPAGPVAAEYANRPEIRLVYRDASFAIYDRGRVDSPRG